MGDTTPKLNLYKPTVEPAETGWGEEVNSNFDILDDALLEIADDDSPDLGGNLDTSGYTIGDSVENAVEFTTAAFFGETALSESSGEVAWDVGVSPAAYIVLTSGNMLKNPTNMKAGATYILRAVQGSGGNKTLTYDSLYLFPGGEAPELSTSASDVDILTFYSDGTNMYGTFLGDFS